MRECTKVRHATREAAMRHREWLLYSTHDSTSVYRCPQCGHWHVGHPADKPRGKPRLRKVTRIPVQREHLERRYS